MNALAEERAVDTKKAAHQGVMQTCPACAETTHVGDQGERRRVTRAVAEQLSITTWCGAEVVDGEPGPKQWSMSRTIPPTVQREVRARCGDVCAVPGCTHRAFLDFHHLHHRADGGVNDPDRIVQLCRGHHRLHHRGRIRIEPGPAGQVCVERKPLPGAGLVPSDPGRLLEALERWSLQPSEVAAFLGADVDAAVKMLERFEHRGHVFRRVDGSWGAWPASIRPPVQSSISDDARDALHESPHRAAA